MCDTGRLVQMSQSAFFTRFTAQQELQYQGLAVPDSQPMLKVKDWPQDEQFSRRMARHNQVSHRLEWVLSLIWLHWSHPSYWGSSPLNKCRFLLFHLHQDFMEMLPLPFLTLPKEAPLNLACSMPSWSNPTDLGPKTYVAFGRVSFIARGPICFVSDSHPLTCSSLPAASNLYTSPAS